MTFRADGPKSSKRSDPEGRQPLTGRNTNPQEADPVSLERRIEEGRSVPIGEVASRREREIDAAERMDNGVRLAAVTEPEAPAIAEAWKSLDDDPDLELEVEDLSRALRMVESKLQYLRGAVDEKSLAARVLDVAGMSAAEVRHQVPALRQAIRDEAGR